MERDGYTPKPEGDVKPEPSSAPPHPMETGGRAFPRPMSRITMGSGIGRVDPGTRGMTMADYAAIHYAAGVASRPDLHPDLTPEALAVEAYDQAIALVEERNKRMKHGFKE